MAVSLIFKPFTYLLLIFQQSSYWASQLNVTAKLISPTLPLKAPSAQVSGQKGGKRVEQRG